LSHVLATRTRRRLEAGVTLTELMVVVVIITILAVSATLAIKDAPIHEGARTISEYLNFARRRAVDGGTVRSDVATAMGMTPAPRSKIVISFNAGTSQHGVEVYQLTELPAAGQFTWTLIKREYLSDKVQLYAGSNTTVSVAGGALPAANGSATITRYFYPDGTADAQTWYLQDRFGQGGGDKYRVWVMPLTGIASMEKTW
jgi:prepilin-type N-terminal cleavage/methylation domain-containing protein